MSFKFLSELCDTGKIVTALKSGLLWTQLTYARCRLWLTLRYVASGPLCDSEKRKKKQKKTIGYGGSIDSR